MAAEEWLGRGVSRNGDFHIPGIHGQVLLELVDARPGGGAPRWSGIPLVGSDAAAEGRLGRGGFFRQVALLDFFFFEYCNLAVVKVLICQVLQGQNRKSNDVCRVGGFTTNSKPIVKIGRLRMCTCRLH
jgi:hypothetical protein